MKYNDIPTIVSFCLSSPVVSVSIPTYISSIALSTYSSNCCSSLIKIASESAKYFVRLAYICSSWLVIDLFDFVDAAFGSISLVLCFAVLLIFAISAELNNDIFHTPFIFM